MIVTIVKDFLYVYILYRESYLNSSEAPSRHSERKKDWLGKSPPPEINKWPIAQFPLYRCIMTQTAAFASSAFLLGYYTLKSSEAATIEKSKRITVSEMVNIKTGA